MHEIIRYSNMNLLITGGAGYIGSHIVKLLASNNNLNITVLDSLCNSSLDTICALKNEFYDKSKFNFIKVELSNVSVVEEILALHKFDAIIHLAAHISNEESIIDPLKYYTNNTVNTTNLINLCVKYDINKFIFSSTAAVYGLTENVPISEKSIKKPTTPYGMSKFICETILYDVAKTHENFKFVVLRYFNVAGADSEGKFGECHKQETHLIPLVVQTALGIRNKITQYGNDYETPDGSCVRDYVHVEDLAIAHMQALSYLNNKHKSNIFNVGYGVGYSVKQIIDEIKNLSDTDFEVDVERRRLGDPPSLVADNSKIIKELSWAPKFNSLYQICKSALKWEQTKKDANLLSRPP